MNETTQEVHMEQYISDVARIRANIEAECEALNNLSLFTRTASHEIISARFKALDEHHSKLKAIVGEDKATEMIVDIYNHEVQ